MLKVKYGEDSQKKKKKKKKLNMQKILKTYIKAFHCSCNEPSKSHCFGQNMVPLEVSKVMSLCYGF